MPPNSDKMAEFRVQNLEEDDQEDADLLFNFLWEPEQYNTLKPTFVWNQEVKSNLLFLKDFY
jgi:hypothetical protein